MSSLFWEHVAAWTDGVVTVEDFETAAYLLVTEQVLLLVMGVLVGTVVVIM